jgi:hypothetical protein
MHHCRASIGAIQRRTKVSMIQPRRPTGNGVAFLVLLLGVVLAFAADMALSLLLSEHLLNTWQRAHGAGLYLLEFGFSALVGVALGLPVLFSRPTSAAIPLAAAVISIPVGVIADLTYLFGNNLYYDAVQHVHISPFSGFGSYFSSQTTVSLISYLASPLAAGLLTGLRVWRVRAGLRTAPAAWWQQPYGPAAPQGPYSGAPNQYSPGPVLPPGPPPPVPPFGQPSGLPPTGPTPPN